MQFQVPQFIEVEDKVIGPFTFKQFIYVVGGVGISFVIYVFLPMIVALPLIGAALAISGALAFYKINNKPFVFFLESSAKYAMNNKLYIWRKEPRKQVEKTDDASIENPSIVPRLSDSKLKDLSWSLDVLQGEEEEGHAEQDSLGRFTH